jgi:DNA mismatch endonuclease, patch repair protein
MLSPEQRSAQMSRIRGSNTRLELLVRRTLHALGLRYRLGGGGLPGKPDLIFPRHATVVFVDGCFWHGHNCHLFRLPKTRPEFWHAKIESNRTRDVRVDQELRALGWRPLHVWECELRNKPKGEQLQRFEQLAMEISKDARQRSAELIGEGNDMR